MEGNGSVAGSGKGSVKKAPSKKGSISRKATTKGPPGSERSVRRLRLSKALTLPDSTTVADACRRMASRRVDACLLTDSNALLCGIMTDRDLALKCVGEGLDVNTTMVSQIMTKNPIFVNVDSSAVDALQKMVQGKFRHLPVIENGEVVALLNITKCLYDAIARMERAAEKGQAIAAAIEGVERQFGDAASGFVETFREKIFRPTLAAIIGDQMKVALVNKGDAVLTAARKMKAMRASAAIITNGVTRKPMGILTSKDILMRVLALSLKPEETVVEKVMTPNPECVNQDTTIVDALHTMHDGKFLHLPVVDNDGNCVACVDVVVLTNGAMSMAAGSGTDAGESQSQLMQRFWDSALNLDAPPEAEDDATSVRSADVGDALLASSRLPSVTGDASPDQPIMFKMEDKKGRVHRFHCKSDSLTELVCAIASRLGGDFDPDNPPSIMYDDEEGDKVVISVDDDLSAAVKFAKASNMKALKLSLDYHGDEEEGEEEHHHPPPQPQPQPQARRSMSMATRPPKPQTQKALGRAKTTLARSPAPHTHREEDVQEEDFSRFERSYQAYTWVMVGVTLVAVTSIGAALYMQRRS